jgi:hypothetical protein
MGNVDAVKDHPGGILFVGNHDKQFEFVALMSFLDQINRTRMKNVVKFYVRNQIDWALGQAGTDIVIPVYPRLLATDRKNKLNLELGSRILFRRSLLSTDESSKRNEIALDAASELSTGGTVNIFPCGRITNNTKKPWRPGLGKIITRLDVADQDEVLIVPYHANNIDRVGLLGAVDSIPELSTHTLPGHHRAALLGAYTMIIEGQDPHIPEAIEGFEPDLLFQTAVEARQSLLASN